MVPLCQAVTTTHPVLALNAPRYWKSTQLQHFQAGVYPLLVATASPSSAWFPAEPGQGESALPTPSPGPASEHHRIITVSLWDWGTAQRESTCLAYRRPGLHPRCQKQKANLLAASVTACEGPYSPAYASAQMERRRQRG